MSLRLLANKGGLKKTVSGINPNELFLALKQGKGCGAAIDLDLGIIYLPDYDATSGDVIRLIGAYIVDGAWVIQEASVAKAAVCAFKSDTEVLATSVAITATGGTLTGNLDISDGNTRQLTATVSPTGASQSGTWSTLNAAVATVSVGGLVTPIGAGTTTIRFTTVDGLIANHTVIVVA